MHQYYECAGPSYKVLFSDHGRVFQAHLAFGEQASDETTAIALSVDSLEIAPS